MHGGGGLEASSLFEEEENRPCHLSASSPNSVACPTPDLFLPTSQYVAKSTCTKRVSVQTLDYTGLHWVILGYTGLRWSLVFTGRGVVTKGLCQSPHLTVLL